jgi:hypothetical protein
MTEENYEVEEKDYDIDECERYYESLSGSDRDPELVWKYFWAEVCSDENGEVDFEQIKKELCDYSVLLDNVPKIFSHVTGNTVSKPFTDPSAVMMMHDEALQQTVDYAIEDEKEVINYEYIGDMFWALKRLLAVVQGEEISVPEKLALLSDVEEVAAKVEKDWIV